MADDDMKALLQQIVDFLPTLATKADVAALDAKITATQADVVALDTKITATQADVVALDTKVTTLDTRVTALDAKVDELRHVTTANHFKLVGRIDQVASMLADHMAEHDHGSPGGGRKRA